MIEHSLHLLINVINSDGGNRTLNSTFWIDLPMQIRKSCFKQTSRFVQTVPNRSMIIRLALLQQNLSQQH